MKVEEYIDLRGKCVFKEWFEGLDDRTALMINTILTRIKHGNNSNLKGVGNGVYTQNVSFLGGV
jgi:putative component of toxin-antitoxin plasmid stabilization module